VCVCVLVGIYCYGAHFVVTVDIMGVIVRKDIRDKIIVYGGMSIFFASNCEQQEEYH